MSSFNFKAEMHLYQCLCDIVIPLTSRNPHREMFRPCLPSGRPRCSKLRSPHMRTVGLNHRAAGGITAAQSTPGAWKSSAASRWWTTWAERQHSPCVRSPGIYPPLYGIRTSSTMVNSTPVKAAGRTQMCFPDAFQSKMHYSRRTGTSRVLILKKSNQMLDLNGDMNTIKA